MKVNTFAALVLGLSVTSGVQAQDVQFDLHLASAHTTERPGNQSYNEQNYGIGVTFNLEDGHGIRLGAVKNSYDEQSYYGEYSYKLYSGDYFTGEVGVGIVSGYEKAGHRFGDVLPFVAGHLTFNVPGPVSPGITILPGVDTTAFLLSMRIDY